MQVVDSLISIVRCFKDLWDVTSWVFCVKRFLKYAIRGSVTLTVDL